MRAGWLIYKLQGFGCSISFTNRNMQLVRLAFAFLCLLTMIVAHPVVPDETDYVHRDRNMDVSNNCKICLPCNKHDVYLPPKMHEIDMHPSRFVKRQALDKDKDANKAASTMTTPPPDQTMYFMSLAQVRRASGKAPFDLAKCACVNTGCKCNPCVCQFGCCAPCGPRCSHSCWCCN